MNDIATILQSNPILESFGNARTVVQFPIWNIYGVVIYTLWKFGDGIDSIETYLLKKVRLISQAPGFGGSLPKGTTSVTDINQCLGSRFWNDVIVGDL
jgi:hypothetical protein